MTTDVGDGDRFASATASDANGNIFVAEGEISSGGPSAQLSLIKFDANGSRVWAVPIESPTGDAYDLSVATTALGNVFVVGAGEVRKFSPAGVLDWSKEIAPVTGMAVNANGSVVIAEDPEPGCLFERCPTGRITQFAYDGSVQWERDNGTVSDNAAFMGVAVDPQENVFTFDGRGHLQKLGPDGSLLWSKDSPLSGALVYGGGHLWMTSVTKVAQFDAQGSLIWQKDLGFSVQLAPSGQGALVAGTSDEGECLDLHVVELSASGDVEAKRDFGSVMCRQSGEENLWATPYPGVSRSAPFLATTFRGTVDFGKGPVTSKDRGFALIGLTP